jgi:ubiquinone/menaquinone biosynthesis C-methylase UbiE
MVLKRAFRWLKSLNRAAPMCWPELVDEIGADNLREMDGVVLNAGAGRRPLQPFVRGKVVNQDIAEGLRNRDIDIYSPLHQIPVGDGHFDYIFCNAVLEHVINPEEVLAEFVRVLKPGGKLYLAVPFMQPEHLDPTDFQRYTKDGLRNLVEKHGLRVRKVEPLPLNVYITLAWVVAEWLGSREYISYWLLRQVLYPVLRYKQRRARLVVDSIASGYRVLAEKPRGPA